VGSTTLTPWKEIVVPMQEEQQHQRKKQQNVGPKGT